MQRVPVESALATLVALLLGGEQVKNAFDEVEILAGRGRVLRYLQIDQPL
jgi:hypothetical protein